MLSPTKFPALILLVALFFAGCKKTEDPYVVKPNTEPETANLLFHIHLTAGNTALNYTDAFARLDGRPYRLSDFRFYLSNFILYKDDGTELPLKDLVFLVSPDNHDYQAGPVPVGNYTGFTFAVGIDSVTNHEDPTVYPSTHPLALQNPTMHWDWASGYLFIKVEGMCDSTADMSGSINTPFGYHIATDNLYRPVEFDTSPFTVNKEGLNEIVIRTDIDVLLDNVDFLTEPFTHSFGNDPLAFKIAGNARGMFTVE